MSQVDELTRIENRQDQTEQREREKQNARKSEDLRAIS